MSSCDDCLWLTSDGECFGQCINQQKFNERIVMKYKNYLIYKAWRYWKRELPIPYDLAAELFEEGLDPSALEEYFDNGYRPEDAE